MVYREKKKTLIFLLRAREIRALLPPSPRATQNKTKKQMSKTQACELALSQVGNLMPMGRQWIYNWFDCKLNGWRQSLPRDYWQARRARRLRLIERATEILHPDHEVTLGHLEAGDYCGGRWQRYVH